MGSEALVASFININHHQLMYGVVHMAVAAERDYMARDSDYGTLLFKI